MTVTLVTDANGIIQASGTEVSGVAGIALNTNFDTISDHIGADTGNMKASGYTNTLIALAQALDAALLLGGNSYIIAVDPAGPNYITLTPHA